MSRKYFGTDGIRGRVGESPITPEFVMKLGWAAGRVFASQGKRKILIGKDTRISGYMFESALEAGLSAAGVDIGILGPMPTPGIAYLTRTFHADAGIVISASHNPYYDNGIKFFSADGSKLDDATEQQIEELLDQPMEVMNSDRLGKAKRIEDAAGRYIEFCKSTVFGLSLKGMRVVLDCAHGATYQIAPAVFTELGADVFVIGNEPDGLNINNQVGSTSPKSLQQKVVELRADLGVAFDGDGDRVVMVDHKGEVVDGDEIIYMIARQQYETDTLQGGVVGTLMSNMGMELALKDMGIPFVRAKVGDRYVLQQLAEHNWSLGGESSGHILCLNSTTTGDGIVAALQALKSLQSHGKNLHEYKQGMSKFPQVMKNVKVVDKSIVDSAEVLKAVEQAETEMAGKGRVLLRPSGTEPVVRVMVEGQDKTLVNLLVDRLVQIVSQAAQ
ncbi:phosphoglucosamine mutase [Bermanella marisrubri]|uniref:Phosphoglucosamine mutase n=1 Tax=Bermanella marisrubri TaxID=207949 RepID=Q1MZR7_9GAMM|nr:phosphoglucosamine mutase [Bermanella marisrubri]EAT11490.1 phosphoglucosamine mutase [Oceanobacter sp. RED65] [Bermanella marisrubri]